MRSRAPSRSRCAATPTRRELTEPVGRLETALERRAMIERAKGILMERHAVDERAAFERCASTRAHEPHGRRPRAAVLEGHALLPKGRIRRAPPG